MNRFPPPTWLPPNQRRALMYRLLIVWVVSLAIAVLVWLGHQGGRHAHTFDVSLVYAYAISTFIWLFADLARCALLAWLQAPGQASWQPSLAAASVQLVGSPLGFVLGMLVGDAYAGLSSWALFFTDPSRFLGILLSSFGISAAFSAYFYQRGKTAALASQVTQAKLLLLQSQLEPHMLFNTLANLRALMASDPARAVAMLDGLVSFLRSTLQASRSEGQVHTLADEFARLRDYLELMAFRMGPRLTYTLDLPDALSRQPMAPMLLQPLVENAIRHGLEPQVQGGSITVSAEAGPGQLYITVQDNGAGCDATWPLNAAKTSGFGLAQLRERIASLHGSAGRIEWRSASGEGTRVRLKWPLRATLVVDR